jgi:hypothetical protein
VNYGVDSDTGTAARVYIRDIEGDDLVVCPRGIGKCVGVKIGQAEAVALAVRVPKGRANPAGGASE